MAAAITTRSYATLFGINLTGQILSFALQALIAKYFGAGADLDGYLAGLAIPQYIILILNTGVNASLLPAYYDKQEGKERNTFVANLLLFLFVFTAGIALVGFVSAGPLMKMFFSRLSSHSLETGITVCRFGFLSVMTGVLVNFLNAIHYVHKKFSFQAAVPAIADIVLIGTMFPLLGLGIKSLLIAFLTAELVQVLLLLPILRKVDIRRRNLQLGDPAITTFLSLTIPIMTSTLLTKSTGLVERYLAGLVGAGNTGTISHVDYAAKLVAAIAGLTTNVLPVLIFPALSESASKRDHSRFIGILRETLFLAFFIATPLVCIGHFVALDSIRIFFERGRFNGADSVQVAAIFQIYLWTLWGRGMSAVTGNAMYALKLLKLVSIVSTLEALLYVGYSYLLTQRLGVRGIPIGLIIYISVSVVWNAVAISYKTKKPLFGDFRNLIDYGKVVLAAAATLGTSLLVATFHLTGAANVIAIGTIGALIYLIVCYVTNVIIVRKGAAALLARFAKAN